MRLEQLRFLCAIAEENFSISRAAEAVHTSQPNVSKQIRLLEQELDVALLRRHSGRIVGLTEAGQGVLALAQGVLRDAARIVAIPKELTKTGELRLATTHLHARYVLPGVIERFRRNYPRLQITLVQADTAPTVALVASGRADIGIASRTAQGVEGLAQLPCFELRRSVIAPQGHPLLKRSAIRLQDIASFPMVAFCSTLAGGLVVQQAFERHGLRPAIAVAASDSETVKTYVRLGFGIAVLPSIAYDPQVDRSLQARDVSRIFDSTVVDILIRPDSATRSHVRDFVGLLMDEARYGKTGGEAGRRAGRNGAPAPR